MRTNSAFTDYDDSEDQGAHEVSPCTVLRYPVDQDSAYDYEAYDVVPFVENENDRNSKSETLRIL